ncbi:MAG: aminotransferase class V-fold PLP-dependent enzyme [Candidatus Kapabacteria bacterium]|nr:aminotransferase class V-fold PLP-dependent enzyme [Ignavibacteriota bacterium]MCW5884353.1 aminotransferase class V-fold PLP-dependent enzyme [Candidatus Kapabacteria bacterium]
MIYLNNSSTGYPKPESVLRAVNDLLASPPYNYGRTGLSRGDKNLVNDTRGLVSEFFNASDEYFTIFTSGSTEALNLVIKGLDLKGKHVIISATEHNSVIRPLMQLQKEGILEISIAECDDFGYVTPQNIEKLITENTALICINHCSNVTGTIQDVKSIAHIAHSHSALLLVDGSQSAGLFTIDLQDINPDFFCFTAHKSLAGIQGTGGLIFRKSIELKPLKQGGTGTQSHLLEQPDSLPYKYESGTMNLYGIAALEAGIKWIMNIGIDNIRKHKQIVSKIIIENLKSIDGLNLIFNENHFSGSIISMTIRDVNIDEVNYVLTNSYDISVRSGLHCAPLIHKFIGSENGGTLRASPSYFTTIKEAEKFSEAMKVIINSLRRAND